MRPFAAVPADRARHSYPEGRARLAGVLADAYSVAIAIAVVAGLTAASGFDVAVRMRETHRGGE